ncbi:efflux RND transporter periplasmic adaptor subunit [Thauera chlorobenzoica]|uniref:Heavy metal RND efflux protein, CusB-like n=1 Tax=Thauera chlorobenzoica TaxID=96773 RepID=A0A1L6F9W6_9RHOO|nr:efflux RND transporter periplasmic adaptor subunit [Thauera chlorobenzoica]APR03643.1 Heavy metal RND efflux protein, CusB-like [Thauera chlorobenzoica]
MTAIAVGVAIAAGAGYGVAHLQNTGNPVPPIGASQAQADRAAPAEGERKILYYRNPMGLPDTSPVPKKDSMGMDYIPVYADDKPDDSGAVAVSPVRIQTLGVKTAEVELRAVDAAVRASGRIEIDERTQVVVAPRFEGWIERLHVNAVGDPVNKGQPLFTAYSPELQSTGEELRIAERLARQSAAHDPVASESARRLAEATRTRLRNLEVAGQAGARQVFHAPVSGVVLDKMAIEGGRFMPGEALFRIADLSKVWIIADVYEQDLARVQVGQGAQITLDAWPGRSFAARVDYLYPTLDPATRSTRVRLELDNAQGLLRPGMFAQVSLAAGDASPRTVVPSSAIIDDGERRVVLIALGEGRFKPQPVKLGERGREVVEVLEGVATGDRVVVSANFLIDSESQLKAALSNLVEPDAGDQSQASPTRYEAQGTFDALDAEGGSVTMTHGEIPALQWPAMTMDFMIADPALVKSIAPGSPVRFVFEAGEPGEYIITGIEPVAGTAPAPSAGGHGGH